jgi:hypothetical protein
MTARKQKSTRRPPDLTVEGRSLTVFADTPRGNVTRESQVVTSYDPSVDEMASRLKAKSAGKKPIMSLAMIIEDCLRTAESIKDKRGLELVKLLRDAQRQVDLIGIR